jgi:Universal stress protein family
MSSTLAGLLQVGALLGLLAAVYAPFGNYMARVYGSEKHWRVERALYRTDRQITDTWETRERVVVALTGDKESETVLRRAARIAKRAGSAELMCVHVLRGDGLAGAPVGAPAVLRKLADGGG